jgi:hypothetical protein
MQLAAKPHARRGTETRQKQHRTTVRWNPDDHAELMARAERAGQSVGTYIRSRCLDAPTTGTRRRPSVDLLAITRLLGQVNRIGGNLHQLVRHLNFGGVLEPGEVRAALRGYDEVVAAIMAALGRQ